MKTQESKDEPLQTRVKNSVSWAEREMLADCFEAFVPTLAERMSFAALQPVSGMYPCLTWFFMVASNDVVVDIVGCLNVLCMFLSLSFEFYVNLQFMQLICTGLI